MDYTVTVLCEGELCICVTVRVCLYSRESPKACLSTEVALVALHRENYHDLNINGINSIFSLPQSSSTECFLFYSGIPVTRETKGYNFFNKGRNRVSKIHEWIKRLIDRKLIKKDRWREKGKERELGRGYRESESEKEKIEEEIDRSTDK